jgi:glycosyltransferase involved in cell wall biosynthesis
MIHDALYPANIATFLLARWLGRPVMLTQHIGAVPYANPILRVLMHCMNRVVTRPVLAAADQVVFISKLTAEKFRSVTCRRPPHIIFNGADSELFHPARDAGERAAIRSQFGLSSDRPVALFVGRFVEKKGLHILRYAAQLGGDIDWVLAGWGNIDPTAWGLANVRVLRGLSQAALAPLYRASDVFVLPSVGEGFPLVLQEAALCGLPMICGAETAKADEKLQPLLSPVDIEYRDPADTAVDVVANVRRAIDENDAAQAVARSARVSGWYSWPRAAKLYLGLFSDMLTTKAVPNGLSTARADQ